MYEKPTEREIYARKNSDKTNPQPKTMQDAGQKMHPMEKLIKRRSETKETRSGDKAGMNSLSLVEFPSKGACPPHQLLELVLLHLNLATSLGADGMHAPVVAHALHICHARG